MAHRRAVVVSDSDDDAKGDEVEVISVKRAPSASKAAARSSSASAPAPAAAARPAAPSSSPIDLTTRSGAPAEAPSNAARPVSSLDELTEDDIPSDVEAAMLLLRQQFTSQVTQLSAPPIVLVHQLYHIINNRTEVDRQVDRLRRANELRLFKLLSLGSDVFAIVRQDDLQDKVRELQRTAVTTDHQRAVLGAFAEYVVPSQFDVSIAEEELLALLRGHRAAPALHSDNGSAASAAFDAAVGSGVAAAARARQRGGSSTAAAAVAAADDAATAALFAERDAAMGGFVDTPRRRSSSTGVKRKRDGLSEPQPAAAPNPAATTAAAVSDAADEKRGVNRADSRGRAQAELSDADKLTLLVHCGLLLHREHRSYWFAIPSIGPVLQDVLAGRKEIVSLIKKKQYKEAFLAELEGRRLRQTGLGAQWLLRDMLGCGLLRQVDTTAGPLLRLQHVDTD